ncbi:(5-formylfuran-3-yl)methyl phosphate synthase [Xanthobacter autotrophicus]|uniref:(5-formylfuran-3-yl)methyl phosphate synthase n=1 Tax=Xanthobacter TaxID=279 RepID=UPI0024AB0566|nr:(5-formylfuran-3-yl)methyl phosphate synthase [Xanthobacter autotrophicus]MDI4664175.1 (5-formylfuran-3-yl)methyl phosphate synthase [Xanthobacter autotrophicus]
MTLHVSVPAAARPGLLASVADLAEMEVALGAGADIVDLKNPAEGALGAWGEAPLRAAVARWRAAGCVTGLSATVGDQPLDAAILLAAARRTAATGVPLVKIGFPLPAEGPGAALAPVLDALAPLARETRLIAVLFADQRPDLAALPHFAAAGFHGVMLDTADKTAGGLLAHLGVERLAGFVAEAKAAGLLTGLAGSLKLEDIAPLAALKPHYLGFRGALCATGRTSALDPVRLARVREALKGRVTA